MPQPIVWPAMSQAVGFTCSCTAAWRDRCIADGTWERPPGAAMAGYLKARLIAGDCPRYQVPNPVDLDSAFTLLRMKGGDAVARETLPLMFEHQAAIPESAGGHKAETLARKLTELAERNGMGKALEAALDAAGATRTTPR